MKKVISIIIMIVLLIGLSITNVQAASCAVNVSASDKTPKIGSTVTVTISFSQGVGSTKLNLKYNTSVLKYKSSSNTWKASASGGSVTMQYLDTSYELPYKTIRSMSATFEVIGEGSSNCSVSVSKMADANSNLLTPSINSSATITVKKEEKPNTNTNTDGNTNTNTNTNTNSNSGSSPGSSNNNNKEPNFRNVNQKVYATSQVNIRKSWSTGSAQLGRLEKGDSITRTGIGDNGWSRVTYNGQTAYINSSYLTTTAPKDDDENNTNSVNNEETNDTNNTEANEQNNTTNEVTNNEEANNEANNEVGNLENAVGNNQIEEEKESPNYILYIIIAIIVIAIIVIIIASIRESKQNRKNRRK